MREEQNHRCNILSYTVTSSILFRPYGSKTAELWKRYTNEANGYKNQGGWQVYETVEYHQIAPQIEFVVVNKSQHGGVEGAANKFIWLDGAYIRLDGIKLRYTDPNNYGPPANQQWRNLFGGQSGNIYFFDCHIDNSNTGNQWNLFSDHDGSVAFKVWNCTTANTSNQIAHIGGKMVLEIMGDNSYVNKIIGDNLHKRSVCTVPEIIAMIANKGKPPKALYKNLDVNY